MNNDDTISRAEAIDDLHGKDPSQIWDTADIEVWINGLPSAQPEQCKDAVSKAKVLETYADLYDVFDDNKGIQNELHKVFDRINNLPPAQPKQAVKDCRTCKHGKYNDYYDTYFCYNAEDCSNWDKWETSAQPEPLSDAYTKAVWTWLLEYQIKAAELKGRYTPYEVLSWVVNDWRKEHEGSD